MYFTGIAFFRDSQCDLWGSKCLLRVYECMQKLILSFVSGNGENIMKVSVFSRPALLCALSLRRILMWIIRVSVIVVRNFSLISAFFRVWFCVSLLWLVSFFINLTQFSVIFLSRRTSHSTIFCYYRICLRLDVIRVVWELSEYSRNIHKYIYYQRQAMIFICGSQLPRRYDIFTYRYFNHIYDVVTVILQLYKDTSQRSLKYSKRTQYYSRIPPCLSVKTDDQNSWLI